MKWLMISTKSPIYLNENEAVSIMYGDDLLSICNKTFSSNTSM